MPREKPYALTNPCSTCPFRTDIVPFLHRERVEEIEQGLVRGEFYCHNTVDYTDAEEVEVEDDEDEGACSHHAATKNEKHCAGALILLEKLERPSQMMRIAERIGLYDRRKLNMTAPVFDTFEDMIEAQEPMPKRRAKRK